MATGRIKKEIEVRLLCYYQALTIVALIMSIPFRHILQDLRNDKASGMSVVVDPYNPKHLTGVSQAPTFTCIIDNLSPTLQEYNANVVLNSLY